MVHVCYGVCFRMNGKDSKNRQWAWILFGGWEEVVIETETTDGNDSLK